MIVSADSLDKGESSLHLPVFKLRQGWRFSEGDDSAWSDPELDDSTWIQVDRPFPKFRGILPQDDWTGVGWFRLTLRLAEDVRFKSLALTFSAIGAADLFVDGRHLRSIGTVGATEAEESAALVSDGIPLVVPFEPLNRQEVVVAVRMSNFWSRAHPDIRYYVGFDLGLTALEDSEEQVSGVIHNRSVHQVFVGASIASIALLHLLFFLFHPRERRNLYHAVFAGCMAAGAYFPAEMYVFATDLDILLAYDFLWKIVLVLTVISGNAFLYESFSDRPPKYALWALAPLGGLILAAWWTPLSVYYLLVLGSFPEQIRTTIRAIQERREGAVIVGIGFGCLILSTSHILLVELKVIDLILVHAYLYGFLSLVLSTSIYLARSFANTSQDLRERVAEVKTLSDRQVGQARLLAEQERERQESETRHRVLEAENAAKRAEIEASRRRQEMLKRLEETTDKIRETQGQLVQSEKMAALGTLVAGIAHEINTPVGAINSMHDTLLRAVDRLKDTIREDAAAMADRRVNAALQVMDSANDVISSGTQRVTGIVRSLRAFARLDDAEMREADLEEGIESTIPLIQHELKQGIAIEKAYGGIPTVACYPSRLNQVFLNILVNASQAIEKEGTLSIRTSSDDRHAQIQFIDTGSGIPEADLARVFDPGFTTKGVGVGTGLGLSICYQIIQDHGGEISIESEVGVGTTVTVTLPLHPEAAL